MPSQSKGRSIFDLQESYATLRGTISVLEDLSLPTKVSDHVRFVKAWCDEWEDLGVPRSPTLQHLERHGSSHWSSLIRAIDRATNVITSETGMYHMCAMAIPVLFCMSVY